MRQLLDTSAKGVYTISATPFTDAGDIDWPSADSLVEFYLQCGVQGLTILGMMGEAQKLSDEESTEFTRHFLRRVDGRVPVIVGVSNPGTANLVKLGKIAMDAGACGVMVAPLTGLKTEAQILTYFADVIAALGEKIPVIYQDYPQSTQADISTQGFLKIVDAHPSVVMFKHACARCLLPAAATKRRICSMCICRSCDTSSSRVLGLPCARKSCAGAAPFAPRPCARRVPSSTPST